MTAVISGTPGPDPACSPGGPGHPAWHDRPDRLGAAACPRPAHPPGDRAPGGWRPRVRGQPPVGVPATAPPPHHPLCRGGHRPVGGITAADRYCAAGKRSTYSSRQLILRYRAPKAAVKLTRADMTPNHLHSRHPDLPEVVRCERVAVCVGGSGNSTPCWQGLSRSVAA